MFKALGLLVGLYVLYAWVTGEVRVKSGLWGKSVSRVESPVEFWFVLAIYAGLAIALATAF